MKLERRVKLLKMFNPLDAWLRTEVERELWAEYRELEDKFIEMQQTQFRQDRESRKLKSDIDSYKKTDHDYQVALRQLQAEVKRLRSVPAPAETPPAPGLPPDV